MSFGLKIPRSPIKDFNAPMMPSSPMGKTPAKRTIDQVDDIAMGSIAPLTPTKKSTPSKKYKDAASSAITEERLNALRAKVQLLAGKQALTPMAKHTVVAIKSEEPVDKFEAYFKFSDQEGAQLSGTMERLMFVIAEILRSDKCFAPTIKSELTINNIRIKGSLQPSINGKEINKLQIENKTDLINFESLLLTILISTIFGMYDLHAFNAKVDEEGNIRFFDNTRSLAHSIHYISRPDGQINPPLRICMISLPESWKDLTLEHKQKISEKLAEVKSLLPNLENYFKDPDFLAIAKTLRKNWFNTSQIIEAMKQRISNIEAGLKDDIRCLADIPMVASPGYRVALGLGLAYDRLTQATWKPFHMILQNVGYLTIDAFFSEFNKKGFQANLIVPLCLDIKKSFKEIALIIDQTVTMSQTTVRDFQEIIWNNIKLLRKFKFQSVPDWKGNVDGQSPQPPLLQRKPEPSTPEQPPRLIKNAPTSKRKILPGVTKQRLNKDVFVKVSPTLANVPPPPPLPTSPNIAAILTTEDLGC